MARRSNSRSSSRGFWRPYVSAEKRAKLAEAERKALAKRGIVTSPVIIEGREIATTFWGKAWCDNLERYADFENRLPRGRTYARNGSIVDLQIDARSVEARVQGSQLYRVSLTIAPLPARSWKSICTDCAGGIDSLVELLAGRLSRAVMERVCRPGQGLFPAPREFQFKCSCPDWASMCKHVAAVCYGVGARLDTSPELLFTLRGVDPGDLLPHLGQAAELTEKGPRSERVLVSEDLSGLFGIEVAESAVPRAGAEGAGGAEARRLGRHAAGVGGRAGASVNAKALASKVTASKKSPVKAVATKRSASEESPSKARASKASASKKPPSKASASTTGVSKAAVSKAAASRASVSKAAASEAPAAKTPASEVRGAVSRTSRSVSSASARAPATKRAATGARRSASAVSPPSATTSPVRRGPKSKGGVPPRE